MKKLLIFVVLFMFVSGCGMSKAEDKPVWTKEQKKEFQVLEDKVFNLKRKISDLESKLKRLDASDIDYNWNCERAAHSTWCANSASLDELIEMFLEYLHCEIEPSSVNPAKIQKK